MVVNLNSLRRKTSESELSFLLFTFFLFIACIGNGTVAAAGVLFAAAYMPDNADYCGYQNYGYYNGLNCFAHSSLISLPQVSDNVCGWAYGQGSIGRELYANQAL